ncbi:hypothetical protein B0H10DRAFT_2085579 [Mycena sp. CBHHK59/15]|nr:hypothetical protein B0H10DRAFT_2085579 [Mycena sp. CBHHK59/15]
MKFTSTQSAVLLAGFTTVPRPDHTTKPNTPHTTTTHTASVGPVILPTIGITVPITVPDDPATNTTEVQTVQPQGIELANSVKDLIESIVDDFNKLSDAIKQDNLNRGQFTQDTVAKLNAQQPKWNYVICHTDHTAKWDGVEGKDWYHSHQEFDIKVGGTIGYEIYGAASGDFLRKGDGGYLNWAWMGNPVKNDQNGAHIVFGAR